VTPDTFKSVADVPLENVENPETTNVDAVALPIVLIPETFNPVVMPARNRSLMVVSPKVLIPGEFNPVTIPASVTLPALTAARVENPVILKLVNVEVPAVSIPRVAIPLDAVTVTMPAKTGDNERLAPKLIVPAVPTNVLSSLTTTPDPEPTTPLNAEPSPTKEVAVTTPVTLNCDKLIKSAPLTDKLPSTEEMTSVCPFIWIPIFQTLFRYLSFFPEQL